MSARGAANAAARGRSARSGSITGSPVTSSRCVIDATRFHPGTATVLERAAMGRDPGDTLAAMDFIEIHAADPARVRRTAAYFLGQDAYEALLPECRALLEEGRARLLRAVMTQALEDNGDDDYEDGMGWRDDDNN
jgi:hypothetical protein